jgi:DNA polymerase-3 subunit epsilon
LDFETTGLDYAKDAIVSFGVLPVRRGRVIVAEGVHQLVEPHVPASPVSMKIHQILPQDLAAAPKLREAREVLHAALERRYLLTWFAEVEVAFLSRIFGVPPRFWLRRAVDVRQMVLVLEELSPDVRVSLSAAAGRYAVPVASPHDALDDALVTAQLFLVLADRLAERGRRRVRDLLALTRA